MIAALILAAAAAAEEANRGTPGSPEFDRSTAGIIVLDRWFAAAKLRPAMGGASTNEECDTLAFPGLPLSGDAGGANDVDNAAAAAAGAAVEEDATNAIASVGAAGGDDATRSGK